MKSATEPENDPRITARIDAALGSMGTVTPAEGLEGRILNRLAQERMKLDAEPRRRPLFGGHGSLTARALGLMTACLMGFVIVAGSVSHSRKVKSGSTAAPPSLVLPGRGVGAASAVHPASPASAPVPASQAARGRSLRKSGPGRARIAPHTRRAPGVAVPAPANAPNSDSPN